MQLVTINPEKKNIFFNDKVLQILVFCLIWPKLNINSVFLLFINAYLFKSASNQFLWTKYFDDVVFLLLCLDLDYKKDKPITLWNNEAREWLFAHNVPTPLIHTIGLIVLIVGGDRKLWNNLT